MVTILQGDCIEEMRKLERESIDSCVTDPPYHLTSNKKGGSGAASENLKSPAGHSRATTGFMGKAWDGGDIAFRMEVWNEVWRVLKPGGHLLAFGGTRTYHRLACAIEDAGFEIRDQIGWLFGSGFPKSRNVGNGWGTGLKPAWEPIVVARKEISCPTVAENVAQFGTGALNIEGCRVLGANTKRVKQGGSNQFPHEDDSWRPKTVEVGSENGRWPANVIHDGSDEVIAAFPSAPGQLADAKQNGERKTRNVYGVMRYGEASADSENEGAVGFKMRPGARRLDSGSTARFFYCAKANRRDRNEGLDEFAEHPLLWSAGKQNPGSFQAEGTHRAARNYHPTVKPTALMRYLCRLVTPPGGIVLDPFAGSGSTGKAAKREGFGFIGIERDAEYCSIARARLEAA